MIIKNHGKFDKVKDLQIMLNLIRNWVLLSMQFYISYLRILVT